MCDCLMSKKEGVSAWAVQIPGELGVVLLGTIRKLPEDARFALVYLSKYREWSAAYEDGYRCVSVKVTVEGEEPHE